MREGPMMVHAIRMPDEMWNELEERSTEAKVSAAALVRAAVEHYLAAGHEHVYLAAGTAISPPPTRPPYEGSRRFVEGWLAGYGEKLKRERIDRGDSLRTLGERLGIRADILHHIEHGRMMATEAERAIIDGWLKA